MREGAALAGPSALSAKSYIYTGRSDKAVSEARAEAAEEAKKARRITASSYGFDIPQYGAGRVDVSVIGDDAAIRGLPRWDGAGLCRYGLFDGAVASLDTPR